MLNKYKNHKFESSCYQTPEFATFAKDFTGGANCWCDMDSLNKSITTLFDR